MRYFLIGFMGCGKTYWGREWSKAFELNHFDLDEEIEKREAKPVNEIFESSGEDAFRMMEQNVLKTYMKFDHFIMSCGGGTPCFFNNMDMMNKKGITIYLKSSVEQLAERLHKEKETRPLIAGMDDEVLKDFIRKKLDQREIFYSKAMYHLPANNLSLENFEKIIRRHGK
jgi:shikimate kinase